MDYGDEDLMETEGEEGKEDKIVCKFSPVSEQNTMRRCAEDMLLINVIYNATL